MTNDDFLERNRRLQETLKALHKERAEEEAAPKSVIDRVRVRIDDVGEQVQALGRPKAAALVLLAATGFIAVGVVLAGTLFSDGKTTTKTDDFFAAAAVAAGASTTTTNGTTSTQCITTTTIPDPVDPNASTTASSAPVTDSGCAPGTETVSGDPGATEESAAGEPTKRNGTTTSRPGSSPTSAGSTPTTGGTIGEPPTTNTIDPVTTTTTEEPTTTTTEEPTTTSETTTSEPETPETPEIPRTEPEPELPPAEPAIPIPTTLPDLPIGL
jgi:hypothetical protein